MKNVFDKLRCFYRYRDSNFFKSEFVNEQSYLSVIQVPGGDFVKYRNEMIDTILSLTNINMEEFKEAVGVENYYSMMLFLFDVNSCLKVLISKDGVFKNHILEVIKQRKKGGLFKNLTKKKINDILSFFSEIVCSSILMSGRTNFILS